MLMLMLLEKIKSCKNHKANNVISVIVYFLFFFPPMALVSINCMRARKCNFYRKIMRENLIKIERRIDNKKKNITFITGKLSQINSQSYMIYKKDL